MHRTHETWERTFVLSLRMETFYNNRDALFTLLICFQFCDKRIRHSSPWNLSMSVFSHRPTVSVEGNNLKNASSSLIFVVNTTLTRSRFVSLPGIGIGHVTSLKNATMKVARLPISRLLGFYGSSLLRTGSLLNYLLGMTCFQCSWNVVLLLPPHSSQGNKEMYIPSHMPELVKPGLHMASFVFWCPVHECSSFCLICTRSLGTIDHEPKLGILLWIWGSSHFWQLCVHNHRSGFHRILHGSPCHLLTFSECLNDCRHACQLLCQQGQKCSFYHLLHFSGPVVRS